jgi:membrane protein required for colicin V production
MSINILDVIIIIPLILWARQGYRKGFVVSVASFAALFLGIYFAFFFSDFAAGLLIEHFTIDPEYVALASFIVTLVVVIAGVLLVGNLVQKFIDALMLGFLNKAAGAVFGLLKGALYLSILIWALNYFDPGQGIIKQKYRDGSMLYAPVASFAPMLYSRLNLDNLKIEVPGRDEILNDIY